MSYVADLSRRAAYAQSTHKADATPELPEGIKYFLDNLKDRLQNPSKAIVSSIEELSKLPPEEQASYFLGGGAGTIGGLKQINKLGLDDLFEEGVQRFVRVLREGGSKKQAQYAMGLHTSEVLNRMGNPGEAMGMFLSPYGEAQVVIRDIKGKLLYPGVTDVAFSGQQLPLFATKLSDLYSHPSLYEISDLLKDTVVRGTKNISVGGGAYFPKGNAIEIGNIDSLIHGSHRSQGNKSASELVDEVVRHEITHVLQTENRAVSRGTSPEFVPMNMSLNAVMNSGKILPSHDTIGKLLNNLDNLDSFRQVQKQLSDIYKANYGEFAAEAGAKYAPETNPGMFIDPNKHW